METTTDVPVPSTTSTVDPDDYATRAGLGI